MTQQKEQVITQSSQDPRQSIDKAGVAKVQWLVEAKRLNPSVSDQKILEIYDAKVAVKVAQQKDMQQKEQWMTQARQLNPNVSEQQIEQIYNTHIAPAKDVIPNPQQQQLEDMQKTSDALWDKYTGKDISPQKVGGSEHVFTPTDKIGILGSLYEGGKIGLQEFVQRLKQLGLMTPAKGREKAATALGLVSPVMQHAYQMFLPEDETEAGYTQEINKELAQNKVYQEALHANPAATAIGKFIGGTAPMLAIPGGEVEGLAAKGAEMAPELLAKYMPDIAKKAVTKSAMNMLAKAAPWIGKGATGAIIGELGTDPTNPENVSSGVAGALANIALPHGAKLVKSLSPAIESQVRNIANKFGVDLPTALSGSFEQMASVIPFTGVKSRLEERLGQVSAAPRQLVSNLQEKLPEIGNYGEYLQGQLSKNLDNAKKLENKYYEQIESLASKRKIPIKVTNYKKALDLLLQREGQLPLSHQIPGLANSLTESLNIPDKFSYDVANTMRKRIGSSLGQASKQAANGSITSDELRMHKLLYGSFKQDMDDFASKHGGKIKLLQDKANKLYQDRILPFITGDFKKILTDKYNTDKFIGSFLKPDQEQTFTKLISLMPEGKEKSLVAMRSAILSRALDKASKVTGIFNPEVFAKESLRLGKVNKFLFSPRELNTLKGYGKMIGYLKKVSPKTFKLGQLKDGGFLHMGEVGAAIWHPHIVLPILLGGNVAIRLITSKAGRSILDKIVKTSATKISDMNPLIAKALRYGAVNLAGQYSGGL